MSPLPHVLATVLSLELLLGGQARLPFSPTPSLYKRAMAKADGTLAAFPFVPLDAVTFTQVIGVAMCLASVGVALPATRVAGWSQWRMEIPYWLPVVNTGLAMAIWTVS
ncbi:hypothetical protein HO133_007363 [Letharia lupina]|uniref:Uncharacterized protein n=1 Tax=Letharia lupina TaxID=560253 RepID=A0A8H6KYU3_9LECA|nr:uncharacterized protein HO133_007363 [Letharia lupina]KAF6229247.1 hypothetical protein HO133_007363 [Letharia lupina]